MTKKKLLGVFFLSLILFSLVSLQFKPKLEQFLNKIVIKRASEFYVQIIPDNLELNFFPPQVNLNKVELNIKNQNKAYAEKISISPNFKFIKSSLRLIKINVSGVKIAFNLKKSRRQSKNFQRYVSQQLKLVESKLSKHLAAQIISSVTFEDAQIEISRQKIKLMANTFLRAKRRFGSVDFELQSNIDFNVDPLNLNFNSINLASNFTISNDKLDIDNFSINKERIIDADLSGSVKYHKKSTAIEPNLAFDLSSNVDIVRSIVLQTNYVDKLPEMSGNIKSTIKLTNNAGSNYWSFAAGFKNLKVDKFNVDSLKLDGNKIKNRVVINRAKINNNGIDLIATFNRFGLDKLLKLNLEINSMNLNPFLANLGVKAPISGYAVGKVACDINYQDITASCQDNLLEVRNFIVTTNNQPMVALKNTEIVGTVFVGKEKLEIDSSLNIADSKLDVNGSIDFDDGFNFAYSSEKLDLAALNNNISGLKVEGNVSGSGTVSGSARTASFNTSLDTKGVWLEDYFLNNVNTNLSYKDRSLFFDDLNGRIDVSNYNANIKINLNNKTISLDGEVPEFELSELIMAFKRRVQLPFDAYGRGKAKINLNGPLKFNRLNYVLTSSVKDGAISDEYFDDLNFNIKANDGHVTVDNVQLIKEDGVITLDGVGRPDGNIDLVISGDKLKLESSQVLRNTNLNLSGDNNFKLTMIGHVLSPTTKLNGSLRNIRSFNRAISDIDYSMQITSRNLLLTSKMLDESLHVVSDIPYSSKLPFELILNANKWDFAPYLSIAGGNSKEYSAFLTADIKLKSKSHWLKNANGRVNISEVRLAKKEKELVAKNSRFVFDNGNMDGFIEMIGNENKKMMLNINGYEKNRPSMSIRGDVDLDLFSFAMPFLEDVRGTLHVKCSLNKEGNNTVLSGRGAIKNAFLNIVNVPHPVEDLYGKISFSKDQLNIDQLKANFASGTAYAKGNIGIVGLGEFPTKIDLKLKDIRLNIPEGVETQGDADIKISGSWFPFLFEGNYNTTKVKVATEFEESDTSELYSSYLFLPKSHKEELAGPIQMNILTNFDNNTAISNSLVEGSFNGSLYIQGQPVYPKLLGRVDLKKDTIIKFNSNEFLINDARFDFKGGDEVNPDINLEATTILKDHTITMYVRGDVDEPVISFASNTNLSHWDIVNLLAVGYTTSETDSISIGTQIQNQALSASTNLVTQNPIHRTIKEKTGVDLRLSTEMEETEEDAIETTAKVVIKKQWTDKISTVLSRKLGSSQTSDMKVEYKLSDKLSIMGNYEELAPKEGDSDLIIQDERNNNILGLDLKYQVYFK